MRGFVYCALLSNPFHTVQATLLSRLLHRTWIRCNSVF
jgi:hypothetical protein